MSELHWMRIVAGAVLALSLLVIFLAVQILLHVRETRKIAEQIKVAPGAVFEPPPHLDKKTLHDEHQATRSHMSHEMDSVRKAAEMARTAANYAVAIVSKLSEKFGVTPPPK